MVVQFASGVLEQLARHPRLFIVIRFGNLALLLGALVWLTSSRELEAALVFGATLLSFIALDAHVHELIATAERHRRHDGKTLDQFLADLPPTGAITFIRFKQHGGKFPTGSLRNVFTFLEAWDIDDPTRRFLDPELERVRRDFVKALHEYASSYLTNVFTMDNDREQACVPRDWLSWDRERFYKAIDELNTLAEPPVALYDELIREARQKLSDEIASVS